MTRAEAFLIQWSALKEEMTKTITVQIRRGGTVRFEELNRVFNSKTKRWSTKVSAEGRWMEEVENGACRQEVLSVLGQLTLKELPLELESSAPALLAGLGGAAVGGVIGKTLPFTTFAMLPVAVGAVCVSAVAFGAVNGRISQKNREKQEALVGGYLAQIDAAGEQIAAVWRKYEPDAG